jgi:hypothetical protein
LPRTVDDVDPIETRVRGLNEDRVPSEFRVVLEGREETVDVDLRMREMVYESNPVELPDVVYTEVLVRMETVRPHIRAGNIEKDTTVAHGDESPF